MKIYQYGNIYIQEKKIISIFENIFNKKMTNIKNNYKFGLIQNPSF